MSAVVHPFPPIFDPFSRVLILGSFPSVVSRREQFYYANRSNRFWPVLTAVFDETDDGNRAGREDFVHRHHIALWDVIYSCTIQGSSDASIANVRVNPIEQFLKRSHIRAVFTTGQRAGKLYTTYIRSPLPHIPLPSTSGANARMDFNTLLEEYRKIRYEIEKG